MVVKDKISSKAPLNRCDSFSSCFPQQDVVVDLSLSPIQSNLNQILLKLCHQIYEKVISFNLSSSNKHSNAPVRTHLQRDASLSLGNPVLSLEEYEIIQQVFSWSLDLNKVETSEFSMTERYVYIGSSIRKIGEIRDILDRKSHYDVGALPNWFEKMAVISLSKKVGNCHEYAALIYSMFMEIPLKKEESVPIEIILINSEESFPLFIHVFVLVNRDPLSDINHPNSWGKNAMIVDPWWEKVGSVNSYADSINRFAGNISCLKDGFIGQGHSSDWDEIFPYGSLLNYTAPASLPENISWANEETHDVLLFAKENLDPLKGGLQPYNMKQLKYFLIEEKNDSKLPLIPFQENKFIN